MTSERLHPLTPVVRMWLLAAVFGWFLIKQFIPGAEPDFDFSDLPWWIWIVVPIMLLSFANGLWEWWTTRFTIDDTELRIDHRGIVHESRRIAYSRIQSVDVTQPFAARVLGLAQLTIDVGAEASTTLSYLSRTRAFDLRDQLMERAQEKRQTGGGDAPTAPPAYPLPPGHPQPSPAIPAKPDNVLVTLSATELILGGLLAHELWFIFLFLGGPLVVAMFVPDVPVEALGAGLIPLALAVTGFLWQRVAGQFRYSLAQTPTGLKITRGMTTLRTQTVPVHRVQAVRITQSILWRLIGRQRVDLVVLGGSDASGDGESDSVATTLLPIGTADDVRAAIRAIWPSLHHDSVMLTPPPQRARWFSPLAYHWMGYGHDDRVVVTRTGWLTRNTFVIPHQRIQSLSLDQGPLDRLLGLATVNLHTSQATSANRILHADAAEVTRWMRQESARARTSGQDSDPTATPASLTASWPPPPGPPPFGPPPAWQQPAHAHTPPTPWGFDIPPADMTFDPRPPREDAAAEGGTSGSPAGEVDNGQNATNTDRTPPQH